MAGWRVEGKFVDGGDGCSAVGYFIGSLPAVDRSIIKNRVNYE